MKQRYIIGVTVLFVSCIVLLVFFDQKKHMIYERFQDSRKHEIVVAQYKEDVGWLEPYAAHVTLYVKSGELNESAKKLEKAGAKVIMLPNVGRESHTYLRYVIDNYDNLPEYVIFTQGALEPHYNTDTFKSLFLKDSQERSTNTDSSYHESKNKSWRLDFYGTPLEPANMTLGEFQNKIVKRTVPENKYPIYWAAIFSVRKKNILNRPKSEYEDMLKLLEVSSNPEVGHFFERSWYYIFS